MDMMERQQAELSEPTKNGWARLVIVLIIALLVGLQVWKARSLDDGLSLIADAFSEANTIRASEGYAVEGFLKHAGLPDIAYGDQFSDTGSKGKADDKGTFVYTHYPPGPDLALGVLTLIFGKGNLGYFRLLPITVGLVGMVVFAWGMARTLGDAKAALMMLGCAVVPMFSNMMHGLHHQGYALALLLVELGLLMAMTANRTVGTRWFVALAVVGFCHGWLTFDHTFLVVLAPVPLAIGRWGQTGLMKRMAVSACVLGLGFVLAHTLHLFQVALYYESLTKAIADLAQSAAERSRGSISSKVDTTPMALLLAYLFDHIHSWRFFGWFFRLAVVFCAALIITGRGRITFEEPRPMQIEWNVSPWIGFLSVLTAGVISSLWILVMWNHAWYHIHYIPRQFFIFYFFLLLAIVQATTVRSEDV